MKKRKLKYCKRQQDKTDCGAACLSSIAAYYGLNLPIAIIHDACGTNEEGSNMKGIIDAANELGMNGTGYKSETKNLYSLINISKPIILHLQKENGWLHFIVLYNINKNKAEIMDPEDGKIKKVGIDYLKKTWSGYLICITPDKNFIPGDKTISRTKRIISLIKENKKDLIAAFLGSIVYTIMGLSISIFIQQIVDNVIPEKEYSSLLIFGIAMLLLFIFSISIGYQRSIFALRSGISIDNNLVTSYFNKLLHLPISFFNLRSTGELNSRISDAYRIRSFISGQLMIIFISIISLIISFALLFTYYWKLALIPLISLPFYYFLYKVSRKINKKTNKAMIESSAKFEENNIEILSAVRGIKYMGAQEYFYNKFEKGYTSMAKKIYKVGKYISGFGASTDGITKCLTFSTLLVGVLYVFKNELSVGELVSFYSITAFFTSPIMTLVESSDEISESQIAIDRLFEILDLPTEEQDDYIKPNLDNVKKIEFEHVSFSYPGRLELFNDLNISFNNGEITCIIGESGCGKSTIASLIMRAYVPKSGKIKIDDINLLNISIPFWRNFISIIPQRADIFNGTILENITPTPEPDINKVIECSKKTGLISLIKKAPNGLLSRTGECGNFLSAGERQKLAFTRALYKDPQFYILDEATASLDENSKQIILNLVSGLKEKGKGIIFITHDEYTSSIADKIIKI